MKRGVGGRRAGLSEVRQNDGRPPDAMVKSDCSELRPLGLEESKVSVWITGVGVGRVGGGVGE